MNVAVGCGMQTAVKQAVKAIRNAEVLDDPWPHLIVNDLFPNSFYLLMVNKLPPTSAWKAFNQFRSFYWLEYSEGDRPNGIHTRPPVDGFWDEFREALFDSLWMELENRLDVVGTSIGAQLMHDRPGYQIGPHTDTSNKLVTGLLYLPKTGSDAKQGTVLCKGRVPDPSGKGHKPGPDYAPVKTVPYVPNSALFFMRTDVSYHCVKPSPVERWLLAFDVFR